MTESEGGLYRRLLRYTWPYRRSFLLAVVGMMVGSATEPVFAALMRPLLNGGFVHRNPVSMRLMPIAVVGLFLVRGVASFASNYLMNWVGRRVVFDIRGQMFSHLLYLPTTFFDAHSSGVLIAKLIYDVEQVASAATRALSTLVKDNATVLGLLGWMFYLNWKLTIAILVAAPVITWVNRRMGKRFRRTSRSIQDSMGAISHVVQEAADGHRVIKTFAGQDEALRGFTHANEANRRENMRRTRVAASGVPVVQLMAASALAWVVYAAMREPHATVGGFMSYVAAMMMLLAPIKRLTQVNETLQTGMAASQSVFSFIDQPPETETGQRVLTDVRGDVAYHDVSFRYSPEGRRAVSEVSFTVPAGQTVALVGTSGSGKTTVANLLPRFYNAESGYITLDGVDTREITLADLRSHIALVSQETVLFDSTIRENILYGHKGVTDDARLMEIVEAAHVAEFLKDLPRGLDTLVGERGVRLSGGQRQRIAIARALLKNAPVLILDEATAALDTESERHVQAAMIRLMQNRTTIVIAHRLSTIEHADCILVMSKGRVVERGTHAELLALNKMYARLHQMQFHG
ncbi:lipid A export permease/ATP-binding protein MsbA [Acidiferrobacter sp. SPIII_3]|uniref:lipid A export permease/ATP-binding protein MsbA n=1 Tax=Acidiferrobacter sp. SPIII_3 TaxID=1281578 RepID=UPI000D73DC9F|nr:lipid A export permease/ATP-binding protein MsbA [Acidiferrobacter sp. SPIII_3]AWP23542.1 lipid A export permease/ATP-binding protein MsbA [Acidiferrobacter sp. SPIII_3]